MYVKTTEGNYFEVVKTEGYKSGTVWKIRSTIYDSDLIYYDYNLGIVMVYDIEYEMEEKEYVAELAKWLLSNMESFVARSEFLKWGKSHGWRFTIIKGRSIFGTNGKEVVMVSGGANGICDVSYSGQDAFNC